jgi:hypothetical protein
MNGGGTLLSAFQRPLTLTSAMLAFLSRRRCVRFLVEVFRMLRMPTALSSVLVFSAFAIASGAVAPSTAMMANEAQQAAAKRVLESNQSKEAKVAALARFVKLDDPEDAIERRFGRASQVHQCDDTRYYYYSFLQLRIRCTHGKVTRIGYWKEQKYRDLAG